MKPTNSNIQRKFKDIVRQANDRLPDGENQIVLMMVKSAQLVKHPNTSESASFYTWKYTVAPAKLTWTGLGNSPTTAYWNTGGSPEYTAFSISELNNTSGFYSYGHDSNDFPAGISPKKIPTDTPVMCCPCYNTTDGSFVYIILNTQAIGGPCA